MAGLKCACCGQNLAPTVKRVLDEQSLCPSCYRKALESKKASERDFEDLLEYIKCLFDVTDVPPDWIEQIQMYKVKEKRTFFGMRGTLYYYYEILGNTPDPERGLWAIRYHYENASRYFKEQAELSKRNEAVDLTPIRRTIIMTSPQNETRKPKYNIEDL